MMQFRILKNPQLQTMTKPYKGRILLLCAASFVSALAQVALALLTRYVIDAAVYHTGKLLFWGTFLVLDLLTLVGLHAFTSWLSGSTMDRFSARLRQQLLDVAAYSCDVRLQGFHSGQLLSRGMEDVRTICEGMVHTLPSLVSQITRLVGAVLAVLLIAPTITVFLLLAAVAVGIAVAVVRPILKKHHKIVRATDEKVMATMQEDLQQLELIQSLQAQPKVLAQFDDRIKENLKAKTKRRVISVGISTVINTCTLTGTGVLLLWGAVKVADRALSYGSLTSMLQLLSLFRGPVLGLSGLWTRLVAVDVAGERLVDLLQPAQEVEQIPVEAVTAIVFENVTFAYPGDDAAVLQNFSAEFTMDPWSCLTGISGKGKSTLFKLILGLYKPDSGRVFLRTTEGEIPCRENTRHLFAYVPQDYALFTGTIRENLLLVSDSDTATREKALSMAQADFVWELTGKDETLIRENNTGLSKGQLQRIAIARAILMDRPILLLDECTSALDSETEERVLQALYALGKQAVLVTHRPEVTEQLPRIIRVKMEK